MTLPAITFAPLDPDEYKRQAVLLKAAHAAHPVQRDGKTEYIKYMGVDVTGRAEMVVYLRGDPKAYAPSEITLAEQPK